MKWSARRLGWKLSRNLRNSKSPELSLAPVNFSWPLESKNKMRVLKAGVVYFLLVFAAGFVFGSARQFWAVPRFGVRISELCEMPLMLLVVILAARWTIRRLDVPSALGPRLGMCSSG